MLVKINNNKYIVVIIPHSSDKRATRLVSREKVKASYLSQYIL